MPNAICCVCDAPIEGPAKIVGSRAFCEKHYDRIGRNRLGLWTATLGLVGGLVLFVLAIQALAPAVGAGLGGVALLIASIVLALVPAIVWLGVFYLQDRLEPEPKGYLLGVFFLAALLAGAVGQPLINSVFRVNRWAGDSLALKVIAGIFIVGIIQEFLKYAAVRYSIFNSQEFDERVDGIIYGAAAGLGYATMLNIAYVIGNGGVDPSELQCWRWRMPALRESAATSWAGPSSRTGGRSGCRWASCWLRCSTASSPQPWARSRAPASGRPR
ncbi:MAG: PrsW family intramembrane metalloprotease [Anaerolineae bacterium]